MYIYHVYIYMYDDIHIHIQYKYVCTRYNNKNVKRFHISLRILMLFCFDLSLKGLFVGVPPNGSP